MMCMVGTASAKLAGLYLEVNLVIPSQMEKKCKVKMD